MECIEYFELKRISKNCAPTVEPRRVPVPLNTHMIPHVPPTSAEVCISGTPDSNGNLTTFVSLPRSPITDNVEPLAKKSKQF